jgi:hypothetical protein
MTTQVDKTTTMNDMVLALESALQDQMVVNMSGGDTTLTAAQYQGFQVFSCTGLTGAHNLTVPQKKRVFIVKNTSSYAITVKAPTGGSVVVAAGTAAAIQNDGTNCTLLIQGGQGLYPGLARPRLPAHVR